MDRFKKTDLRVIGYSYKCPVCGSMRTYFSVAVGWECEHGHHFVPDALRGSGIEHGSLAPSPTHPNKTSIDGVAILDWVLKKGMSKGIIAGKFLTDVTELVNSGLSMEEAVDSCLPKAEPVDEWDLDEVLPGLSEQDAETVYTARNMDIGGLDTQESQIIYAAESMGVEVTPALLKAVAESVCDGVSIEEAISWNLK